MSQCPFCSGRLFKEDDGDGTRIYCVNCSRGYYLISVSEFMKMSPKARVWNVLFKPMSMKEIVTETLLNRKTVATTLYRNTRLFERVGKRGREVLWRKKGIPS